MFSKKITDSDTFYEMSSTAQALYFHLNQAADDDGFNNQIQIAMFKAHANADDLKILMAKKFIIRFENGVIVIKHWRLHNTIRKDRYTPTNFKEELALLNIKENGSYTLSEVEKLSPNGCQTVAKWLPNGCQTVATGKDSIDKDSISQKEIYKEKERQPIRHKYGEYKNVFLSDEDMDKLKKEFPYDYEDRIERLSSYIASTGKNYKNHLATIRSWARKDNEKSRVVNSLSSHAESINTKAEKKDGVSSFDGDDFFAAALAKEQRRFDEYKKNGGCGS